jgi:hypothetical protein
MCIKDVIWIQLAPMVRFAGDGCVQLGSITAERSFINCYLSRRNYSMELIIFRQATGECLWKQLVAMKRVRKTKGNKAKKQCNEQSFN